jgi:hypothetical protein
MKKACYGFSSFEHLRKRAFLVFDKNDPRKSWGTAKRKSADPFRTGAPYGPD